MTNIGIYFFICDQPHTLKTARNNIAHSGFGGKSSRLLWNDGHYVIWDHISKLLMEDLECGLQLCPKVITEHINLTPYPVMKLQLAAEVLSTSGWGVTLSMRGRGRAEASAILTPKIRRIQWLYVVETSGWRTNY